MSLWKDLLGTVQTVFRIGLDKATINASGLTAPRSFLLPDASGTLVLTSQLSSVAVSALGTRIRRSINQSIPPGTGWTDLVLDTSAYQTGGAFWSAGATLTFPESGLFQVFVEATMDGAGLLSTVTSEMQVLVNDTSVIGADFKAVSVGLPSSLWVMAQRNFTVGNTLKVQVRHSNSSAINILSEGDHAPDVIFARVGGVSSGGSSALVRGVVTVNCGVGSDQAQMTVAAPTVTATSLILLNVSSAGTADHSLDEHLVEDYTVAAANIIDGVGFDVVMTAKGSGLDGNYAFSWAIA